MTLSMSETISEYPLGVSPDQGAINMSVSGCAGPHTTVAEVQKAIAQLFAANPSQNSLFLDVIVARIRMNRLQGS
jgi:hypothetical protein